MKSHKKEPRGKDLGTRGDRGGKWRGRGVQVIDKGADKSQVPESPKGLIINVQEVGEVQTSTSLATIDNPPLHFLRLATSCLLLLLLLFLHLPSLYSTTQNACHFSDLDGESFLQPSDLSWPPLLPRSALPLSWSESLFEQVLAMERLIFGKCTTSWSQFKLFLLKALYGITMKLERHTVWPSRRRSSSMWPKWWVTW